MPSLFDTHSHYNISPLYEDWQNLAKNAQSAGITKSVVVGVDAASSQVAVNMREKLPAFFLASAGLHPDVATSVDNVTRELAAFCQLDLDHFAAYGELGLDFFHLDRQAPTFVDQVRLQIQLLQSQLDFIALHSPRRPLIFHVRDVFCNVDIDDNAYGLLIKNIAASRIADFPLIFHCFSGNQAYLARILEFSQSYISFAGNLTFKSAGNLRELLRLVPPNRLLLETDAPFLSPEPCRGQPCQPVFLRHTATYAARALQVDLDQVYTNSCQLFSLT